MANKQHAQFSDENGNIYYLENQTEDVLDPSGKPLSNGGDLSEASVTFTADSTRTLPKSGSRFKAFCGSVLKFLSDLKTVSFSGSYNDLSNKPSIPSGAAASQAVANNCTTTAAGSVLDARQGKVLMDKANQLSSDLASHTHTFSQLTGGIISKILQWTIGSNDYVQLRENSYSDGTKGISFVFHDSSTNDNEYHNIFDGQGKFQLSDINHNHDDRYSRTTHTHDGSYYPIGEAAPTDLPSTNLNSCRVNMTCAFSESYLDSYANLPVKVIGIFRSTVCGGYCLQEYFTNESEYYHRIYTSEGWKPWK